jgi:hypothetical protein
VTALHIDQVDDFDVVVLGLQQVAAIPQQFALVSREMKIIFSGIF